MKDFYKKYPKLEEIHKESARLTAKLMMINYEMNLIWKSIRTIEEAQNG